MEKKYIATDFDGSVVTNDYPIITNNDIGSVPVLKELVDAGHKLILCTMRSGQQLEDAINWFKAKGIPLYDVNDNKSQHRWTTSRKIFADLYIDDTALGAPLKFDSSVSDRPFLDWARVREMLVERGFLE